MRKTIRTILFGTLTIGSYLWIVFQLFFKHNIITSIIGLLVFFIVFQFFYLDIYHKDNKKTIVTMLIITLIEVLILNFLGTGIMMIIGLIMMNGTIIYISTILKSAANKSIVFTGTGYFLSAGYIFTLGMTIAYCFFIIGLYNKFPFSCEDLSKNSGKVIETVLSPLNIGWIKDKDVGAVFGEAKVKDLLSMGKVLNIESDIKGITPLENFKNWKNELITKTLNENKELNQGICEYSLNKLNTKMENTNFQIGVIILMVAVSYPFLRIAIQIMGYIGLLLFRTIKKCKGYSVEKIITEIERIK